MTEAPDLSKLSVAISIATFRRPQGLKALLASLDAMDLPPDPPAIRIIVTDNAPEAAATETLGPIDALSRWPVIYTQEPVRGIVAARNRGLDTVPEDVDYVTSLDDDETVSAGWLIAMLTTMETTGAVAAVGPVSPVYEVPPPAWIEKLDIFRLGPFQQAEALRFGMTGNCCFRAAFLRQHKLRFDMRFNQTGGEDEELFFRIRARGGRVAAAADALVHDSVPAGRLNARWVLKREHRKGNTLTRIALLHGQGPGLRLVKAFGAIGYGGLLACSGLIGAPARRMHGIMQMSRGLGMLRGFLRLHVAEYSAGAVARDRSAQS
ncbi:MAG: glycosyltransferase [Pseudomonadota bacterium]